MRKINVILVAFALMGLSANAQTWQWANRMGSVFQSSAPGNNNEQIANVKLDGEGNIYVAGKVMGFTTFGDTEITNSFNQTGFQGFLAKYNCEGTLLWVQMCLSNQQDDDVKGLAVDSLGNCYIIGTAEGTVTHFGDSSFALTNSGNSEWFMAKYDNNGVFQWVRFTTGSAEAYFIDGSNIAINSQGFIIATGMSGESGTIFPNINLHRGDFLVAYTSFGTAIWGYNIDTFTFNGSNIYICGLTIDNNDNIYIAGCFGDTISIGTQILDINPNIGSGHSFIAKFSSGGIFQWAKQSYTSDDWDGFYSILSLGDNLYVYGTALRNDTIFNYPVQFAGNQTQTCIILKLNNAGNLIRGITQDSLDVGGFGGPTPSFATDANQNIYLTNCFGGILKWGNIPSISSSTGMTYIMKLDSALNVQYYVMPSGVGGYYDCGEGIAINSQGDIYVAGAFSEILYVGPDTINNSGGNNDLYLLKYGGICATTGIEKHNETNNNSLSLYPNPTISLLTISLPNNNQKAIINLYDMLGEKVLPSYSTYSTQSTINLTNLPQGIYFLEVLMDGEKMVRKVVKM